jgi:ribosomal protein L11 methyltransferase
MLTEVKVGIPFVAVGQTEDVLLEVGDGRWSLLEDAIAKRAWIVGIFEEEPEARAEWARLEPLLPVPRQGGLVLRGLGACDWAESYKDHFHAWQFGRLHWVPAWERGKFQVPPEHFVLWLDPGMAFGTGNHETTRLCVERLVALAEAEPRAPLGKSRVVDAGCGSGILALSAALLGFGEVEGFDNDPEAVRVSRGNAELNGLANRVKFAVADLAPGLAQGGAAVVLANIQADILIGAAADLTAAVAPGGTLVMSGILASERDDVAATFRAAAPGWTADSRILGEWADLALARP